MLFSAVSPRTESSRSDASFDSKPCSLPDASRGVWATPLSGLVTTTLGDWLLLPPAEIRKRGVCLLNVARLRSMDNAHSTTATAAPFITWTRIGPLLVARHNESIGGFGLQMQCRFTLYSIEIVFFCKQGSIVNV